MDTYKFYKSLTPGYTGYQAICAYNFEYEGENQQAQAAVHFFEGDIDKEIPKEIEEKLKSLINKEKQVWIQNKKTGGTTKS